MKKVIIALLCLGISATAVNAQEKKSEHAPVSGPAVPQATTQQPDPNAGKFKFEEQIHDFGEVMEGPTAECDFEFRNVGKSPIIITEAHGSCGCTVPKWPQEPILPKRKGVIHVTYNTAGRVGPINKDVFITSNAEPKLMRLRIIGTVKAKPDETPKRETPPPATPIK